MLNVNISSILIIIYPHNVSNMQAYPFILNSLLHLQIRPLSFFKSPSHLIQGSSHTCCFRLTLLQFFPDKSINQLNFILVNIPIQQYTLNRGSSHTCCFCLALLQFFPDKSINQLDFILVNISIQLYNLNQGSSHACCF